MCILLAFAFSQVCAAGEETAKACKSDQRLDLSAKCFLEGLPNRPDAPYMAIIATTVLGAVKAAGNARAIIDAYKTSPNDPRLAFATAQSLQELGDPHGLYGDPDADRSDALRTLVAIIQNPAFDRNVKIVAIDALRAYGSQAREASHELAAIAMNDYDLLTGWNAVTALIKIGIHDRATVSDIEKHLDEYQNTETFIPLISDHYLYSSTVAVERYCRAVALLASVQGLPLEKKALGILENLLKRLARPDRQLFHQSDARLVLQDLFELSRFDAAVLPKSQLKRLLTDMGYFPNRVSIFDWLRTRAQAQPILDNSPTSEWSILGRFARNVSSVRDWLELQNTTIAAQGKPAALYGLVYAGLSEREIESAMNDAFLAAPNVSANMFNNVFSDETLGPSPLRAQARALTAGFIEKLVALALNPARHDSTVNRECVSFATSLWSFQTESPATLQYPSDTLRNLQKLLGDSNIVTPTCVARLTASYIAGGGDLKHAAVYSTKALRLATGPKHDIETPSLDDLEPIFTAIDRFSNQAAWQRIDRNELTELIASFSQLEYADLGSFEENGYVIRIRKSAVGALTRLGPLSFANALRIIDFAKPDSPTIGFYRDLTLLLSGNDSDVKAAIAALKPFDGNADGRQSLRVLEKILALNIDGESSASPLRDAVVLAQGRMETVLSGNSWNLLDVGELAGLTWNLARTGHIGLAEQSSRRILGMLPMPFLLALLTFVLVHGAFWITIAMLAVRRTRSFALIELAWNPKFRDGILGMWYVRLLLQRVPNLRKLLFFPLRGILSADIFLSETGEAEELDPLSFFDKMEVIDVTLSQRRRDAPPKRLLASNLSTTTQGRIVIEGESGVGKTTLLRCFIKEASESEISVALSAKHCKSGVRDRLLAKFTSLNNEKFVLQLLAMGKIRVYIDGLNEAPASVFESIESFITEFPNCPIVVTSQPLVSYPITQGRLLRIAPLTLQQASDFLKRQKHESLSPQSSARSFDDFDRVVDCLISMLEAMPIAESDRRFFEDTLSNAMQLTIVGQLITDRVLNYQSDDLDSAGRITASIIDSGLRDLEGARFREMSSAFRVQYKREFRTDLILECAYSMLQSGTSEIYETALDSDKSIAFDFLRRYKIARRFATTPEGVGSAIVEWQFRHGSVIDFFAAFKLMPSEATMKLYGDDVWLNRVAVDEEEAGRLWVENVRDHKFFGCFRLLAARLRSSAELSSMHDRLLSLIRAQAVGSGDHLLDDATHRDALGVRIMSMPRFDDPVL